ncbi:hypothetical protein EI555_006755, partial [Monodon monoceros]
TPVGIPFLPSFSECLALIRSFKGPPGLQERSDSWLMGARTTWRSRDATLRGAHARDSVRGRLPGAKATPPPDHRVSEEGSSGVAEGQQSREGPVTELGWPGGGRKTRGPRPRLLPGVPGSHLTDPSPDGGARGRGWGVNPNVKPVGPLMSAGRARGRPRCPAQTGAGAPGSPGCGLDPTNLKPCGGLGAEFGRRGRRADSEPALRGAQLPPAGPRSSALRSSTTRHVSVCLAAGRRQTRSGQGTLRPPGYHGVEPGSSTAEPEAVGDPQRSTRRILSAAAPPNKASLLRLSWCLRASLQLWLRGPALPEKLCGASAHRQARQSLPGEPVCPSPGVQQRGPPPDRGQGGGLSQEAEGARTPRVRTASTAEQVSALLCSFRHRCYRCPLLAREMQLSEVQARGHSVRPWRSDPPPSALGCVRPATAVPMGILAWAPSSGPASGLLLGSLTSGTSLPGFHVGLVRQAAPQTPGARAVPPQQEREGPSLPEARLEAASPLEERAGGADFPEGSDTALKGCLRRMDDRC